MNPALIKYSDESDESEACATASGAQLSETLSATIRIPSRLNINLTTSWSGNIKAHITIKLKPKRKTSKNAALHYGRRGIYEVRQKFQVPVIQQVLPADGQFQASNRPPTQVRIQRVVTGQIQAGKVVHKSKRRVLIKMLGQVNGRPQVPLMTRA